METRLLYSGAVSCATAVPRVASLDRERLPGTAGPSVPWRETRDRPDVLTEHSRLSHLRV